MRARRWMAAAAGAAAMAVGAAPAADAATPGVTIEADRVTVATTGAVATVERSPFRMTFSDGAGRTVLSQVPNPAAPVTAPIAQDEPMPSPAAYAPLSFTVGTRKATYNTFSSFSGQVTGGRVEGTQYSARSVASAVQAGDGADLALATSDPSGRRLTLELRPGADGASIRVSVRAQGTGVATLSDSFTSGTDEAFRGFGGRHEGIDQRGNAFNNWIEAEKTDGKGAYYVQSLFVSSRPYGFMVDRDEMSSFRLAADRADAWQASIAGGELDYVVTPGAAPDAIRALTRITGRQPVAPKWALGAIESQVTPAALIWSADEYRREVDDDIAQMDRYETPATAFQLHQWWFLTPAQLESYVNRFHARGMRVMGYFKAFVDGSGTGYDSPADQKEAHAKGYTAKNADGSPTDLVDFSNPAAVTWWKGRVTKALDAGIDGFMQDYGESIVPGLRFHDGTPAETMHNRYPRLYHRATREAVEAYEAAHPDREIWFFTRAGFNGSTAHEGGNFGGDNDASFGRENGLPSATVDMLNRGIGGAVGYTTDIGGYFDSGFGTPREVFLRWAQWAALSPFFRVHNSYIAGTKHSWSYAFQEAETTRIYNRYAALHIKASDLIQSLWREARETGMPIARPLWLAFPGDAKAAEQDQQWMLGPDVLVAPVVADGARSRPVYFPAGCWRSPDTGEEVTGPVTRSVAAPLDTLPYYFRCGTRPF